MEANNISDSLDLKKTKSVHDYYHKTLKHMHYKRKRIADPDGIVTYTN